MVDIPISEESEESARSPIHQTQQIEQTAILEVVSKPRALSPTNAPAKELFPYEANDCSQSLQSISDDISNFEQTQDMQMISDSDDVDSQESDLTDPNEYETRSMRSRHRKLNKLPIPSHFRHLQNLFEQLDISLCISKTKRPVWTTTFPELAKMVQIITKREFREKHF
jgi:hypothetical protein